MDFKKKPEIRMIIWFSRSAVSTFFEKFDQRENLEINYKQVEPDLQVSIDYTGKTGL
jgi:hypothetical protein